MDQMRECRHVVSFLQGLVPTANAGTRFLRTLFRRRTPPEVPGCTRLKRMYDLSTHF